MPLPILQQRSAASDADLVRLYLQTDRRWAQHLAEPVVLTCGTVFCDPGAPQEQGHVRDALVPEGMTAQQAVADVEAHFARAGGQCQRWLLNPAVPPERTAALGRLLAQTGWQQRNLEVLALPRMPLPREAPGSLGATGHQGGALAVQIIPSRAAYGLTEQLMTQAAKELGDPGLWRRVESHLDDSHVDALLALDRGRPLGHAAIFSVGELARLGLFYVAPECRRRGIGRALLERILELARRSLHRHILAAVEPLSGPAQGSLAGLWGSIGMKRAGLIEQYIRPAPDPAPAPVSQQEQEHTNRGAASPDAPDSGRSRK
jgi:GNAT superfamily N-acetyltransferase